MISVCYSFQTQRNDHRELLLLPLDAEKADVHLYRLLSFQGVGKYLKLSLRGFIV